MMTAIPCAQAPIGRSPRDAHNDAQRHYFESRTPRRMWPRASRYLERHVEEALAQLGSRQRVLEVGCGMGRYTLPMRRRGIAVEGLDLSAPLLDRMREFCGDRPSPALHAGDVLDPPSALLGAFDGVVGFFVLHHLPDLRAGFRGVQRLLRPGGRAVFIEPNAWNPLFALQIALTPRMSFRAERGIFDMREQRLRTAALEAGLTPIAVQRFGLAPPAIVDRPLGAWLEHALERLPGPHWSRAFLSICCDRL